MKLRQATSSAILAKVRNTPKLLHKFDASACTAVCWVLTTRPRVKFCELPLRCIPNLREYTIISLSLWLAGAGSAPNAAPAAATRAQVAVLEDFEAPQNWFTWSGDADPRPTGGMEAVADDPHGGKQCGSFFFDTSCDNGYVSTDLARIFPPQVTALRFWVRSAGSVTLTLRLLDSTGQTHQQSLPQEPAGWHRIELDLSRPTPHHFGGANDGQFHQPFAKLQFLRERGCAPKAGTIYLDDVEVVTATTTEELTEWYWNELQVRAETGVPGSLFYPTERATMDLSVGTPPNGMKVTVRGQLLDALDQPAGEVPPVELSPDNGYRAALTLPSAPGYYRVQLSLSDGKRSKERETRFAVIPNNRRQGADPDSPFGVNTHFNQGWPASLGEVVRRAGIAWVRDGEASLDDRALPVALDNDLCYLPCFTAWTNRLTQRFKETLAKDPNAERTWDFSEAVAWHRQYAEKYGKYVDAYDLMNEPHGPWSEALGGGWQGGEWLRTFADYGKQVTDALHQADPGAKVLWEDIDQLLWYREFAGMDAAKTIDAISPHPYNLHPSRPYPEQQPTLEQMRDFRAFVAERKLSWEVWAGEVGFSSFRRDDKTPTQFYTALTEAEQAQLLVRMMVLQLAHGVKRIFWYDFMNDGWEPNNPEHNFGLVRNDHQPKPAIVAYANLIHRLRHAAWIKPYVIGGGAYAFAYAPKGDAAKPVLIAWVMAGTATEAIPVASGAEQAVVVDLYGRTQTVPVRAHRLTVGLTPSPTYIEGLTDRDLLPHLTQSSAKADPEAGAQ